MVVRPNREGHHLRQVARLIGVIAIGVALSACGAGPSPREASRPTADPPAQQVQHFISSDYCSRVAHLVTHAVTSCWKVSSDGFVAGLNGTSKSQFIATFGGPVLRETVNSMSGPMYVLGGDGLDVVLSSPDFSQLAIYNLATGGTAFVRPTLAYGIPGIGSLPRSARGITLTTAFHGRYYSNAVIGRLAGIDASRVQNGEVLGKLVVVGMRRNPRQRAQLALHLSGSRTTVYMGLPWKGAAIVLGASVRGLIVENHNTPHHALVVVVDLQAAQELRALTPKETQWPQ